MLCWHQSEPHASKRAVEGPDGGRRVIAGGAALGRGLVLAPSGRQCAHDPLLGRAGGAGRAHVGKVVTHECREGARGARFGGGAVRPELAQEGQPAAAEPARLPRRVDRLGVALVHLRAPVRTCPPHQLPDVKNQCQH